MGELMRRFVEEADRGQWTLLPECLDDFIGESNPVRVIDVFVDALDLAEMSFERVEPADTGHEHRRYQAADGRDRGLRHTWGLALNSDVLERPFLHNQDP
jgi:hypothetical protein